MSLLCSLMENHPCLHILIWGVILGTQRKTIYTCDFPGGGVGVGTLCYPTLDPQMKMEYIKQVIALRRNDTCNFEFVEQSKQKA